MKADHIGNKAAHISWAVFVFMLVVKWFYPGVSWLVVFAPFLIPIGVVIGCFMVLAFLLGMAQLLVVVSRLIKHLRGHA